MLLLDLTFFITCVSICRCFIFRIIQISLKQVYMFAYGMVNETVRTITYKLVNTNITVHRCIFLACFIMVYFRSFVRAGTCKCPSGVHIFLNVIYTQTFATIFDSLLILFCLFPLLL